MKRVKAACITQTLHFLSNEDMGHDYAVKLVSEEVKKYKEQLDKKRHRIRFFQKKHKRMVPLSLRLRSNIVHLR